MYKTECMKNVSLSRIEESVAMGTVNMEWRNQPPCPPLSLFLPLSLSPHPLQCFLLNRRGRTGALEARLHRSLTEKTQGPIKVRRSHWGHICMRPSRLSAANKASGVSPYLFVRCCWKETYWFGFVVLVNIPASYFTCLPSYFLNCVKK